MPLPIDQRKKPTEVKVHVKNGAGVDIAWADGHTSHFEFAFLRDNCPCATCNDERGKKESMAAMNLPASAALPMYKPKPRAQSASQVGNYAIQINLPTATPRASSATTICGASALASSAPKRFAKPRRRRPPKRGSHSNRLAPRESSQSD